MTNQTEFEIYYKFIKSIKQDDYIDKKFYICDWFIPQPALQILQNINLQKMVQHYLSSASLL